MICLISRIHPNYGGCHLLCIWSAFLRPTYSISSNIQSVINERFSTGRAGGSRLEEYGAYFMLCARFICVLLVVEGRKSHSTFINLGNTIFGFDTFGLFALRVRAARVFCPLPNHHHRRSEPSSVWCVLYSRIVLRIVVSGKNGRLSWISFVLFCCSAGVCVRVGGCASESMECRSYVWSVWNGGVCLQMML